MKEDDMDEMMRKAAENYEVDAEKAADWNAVYTAVHGDKEPAPVEEKKKRRGFAFWWLFLIPLGWIAHTEYNKLNDDKHKRNASSTAAKQSKTNSNKFVTNNSVANKLTDENSKQEKSISKNNMVGVTKNQLAQNQPVLKQLHKNIHSNVENKKHNIQADKTIDANINEVAAQQKQSLQIPTASAGQSNINQSKNIVPAIVNDKKDSSSIANSDQSKKTEQPSGKKSSVKKDKNNSRYFYAGLIAGSDLSFIKYQKAQSLGYNAGLLIGYKFNKLSVESGLLLDQKNYYTNGDNFDKSRLHYFDNAELLKAYGYCKMFEVPLNIKYDFSTKKNHSWFATAGVSSYFMNKEFYHFDYIKDGLQRNGSYPYYHTTKNWFSVANVSAGYQLQMPNKINLRIEPYYKIPLNGVGLGSLHIVSAGLNVGITRKIP